MTWVDQPLLEVCFADAQESEPEAKDRRDLPDGEEYRWAPLLAVLQLPSCQVPEPRQPATAVVVGRTHVYVDADGSATLRVRINHLWLGPEAGRSSRSGAWRAQVEFDARIAPALRDKWAKNSHARPSSSKERATRAAKALAENSRNSLSDIRDVRYEVERRLGLHLRREPDEDLELVLADVVEMLVLAGRARDVARECVREGLQLWINDPDMYHAQRRMLDRSLPSRDDGKAAREDPTFLEYDAAIRQCLALDQQLAEEAEALRGLLASGSAIAATRDAQAQEKFTVLATVSAVALGLPALVLTLYGASAYLPFEGPFNFGGYRLLYPVLGAGLLAAFLAASLPGKGKRRWRFAMTLAGVLILFYLLAVAGRYGPVAPPDPAPSPSPAARR